MHLFEALHYRYKLNVRHIPPQTVLSGSPTKFKPAKRKVYFAMYDKHNRQRFALEILKNVKRLPPRTYNNNKPIHTSYNPQLAKAELLDMLASVGNHSAYPTHPKAVNQTCLKQHCNCAAPQWRHTRHQNIYRPNEHTEWIERVDYDVNEALIRYQLNNSNRRRDIKHREYITPGVSPPKLPDLTMNSFTFPSNYPMPNIPLTDHRSTPSVHNCNSYDATCPPYYSKYIITHTGTHEMRISARPQTQIRYPRIRPHGYVSQPIELPHATPAKQLIHRGIVTVKPNIFERFRTRVHHPARLAVH